MTPNKTYGYVTKIVCLFLFAIAIGFFESAVVVYLRGMFYPEGFSFPLKDVSEKIIIIELFRELSSIVILVTVATLSGKKFWERFGFFILIFGLWDIFYYVWLKITVNWPSTLLDWDILFLIPAPWIAPVIAPIIISVLMILVGLSISSLFRKGYMFKPTLVTWVMAIFATALILFSFMRDYDAMYNKQMPQPYHYELLISGLILYMVAYLISYKKAKKYLKLEVQSNYS